MSRIVQWFTCWLLLGWHVVGDAHKQSDSYLSITQADGTALHVQWDIALRDLEHAIGLDVDADAAITWGELKQRQQAMVGYAISHLGISGMDGNAAIECPLRFTRLLVDEHVDGKYAVMRFHGECARRVNRIDVHYSLLFDVDPDHRGLLDVRSDGNSQAVVLARDSRTVHVNLGATSRGAQFASFVTEGIWHIWQGYDHVLFLLTLLLPAVVMYRAGRWEPRESLRESMLDVVKVVTAFTLAHSMTLTLGALGLVYVPSRIVESAIAVTVLLGALNILFPVVRERRWLVAFVFGLIHGLGFASVLVDLGLSGGSLLLALLGFNAGVEVGQLAIVVVVIPLMFAARRTKSYRRGLMPVGAVAVACIATYWCFSRALA